MIEKFLARLSPSRPLGASLILLALAGCGDSGSSSANGGNDGTGASAGSEATGGSGSGASNPGTGGSSAGGNSNAGGNSSTGGSSPCADAPAVSFATDIQPLLVEGCSFSSCHGGAMPDANLNLTDGNVYEELVNVATAQCNGSRTLVVPGAPEDSYLINKLRGQDMCGGVNSKKMPRNLPPGASAPPWTDAETALIEAWICGGALDN